jgi:putative ABC transport system ATP-binding protein
MTGDGSVSPVLRLRGVKKTWPEPAGGTLTVLDIPSWEVEAGAHLALVGGSGSGKSTLLSILSGILLPDAGSVEVLGQDIVRMGEAARDRFRGRSIGLVFQSLNLFQTLTARENLLAAPLLAGRRSSEDEARADALLERIGLKDRARHRPAQLSLGEQQRVAIARAVMNRPPLLLADEPTGSLDGRRRDEVVTLLRSVAEEVGAALVVVTHDEAVVASFPRTVRIEELSPVAGPR